MATPVGADWVEARYGIGTEVIANPADEVRDVLDLLEKLRLEAIGVSNAC